MPSNTQDAALILVGHGSTLNPDSSAPTLRCAEEIRRRALFAEVACGFWKEEPSMREVFYMLRSRTIYIVPNFISEGYFTREVLPRELCLDGPVTRREGATIIYCDPVGIHRSMTRLLLHRAGEVAPGVPREQSSLVIAGHGTGLNEQSRKAIEAQVAFIREGNSGFAEVLDAYMEEAPFLSRWHEITSAPNVVVVPFFIADGLHSHQEIPVLLGIAAAPTGATGRGEIFRENPRRLRGRRLYYSGAIGTDPLMVDVILDQVADARARLDPPAPDASVSSAQDPIPLPAAGFTIGQVRAQPMGDGAWILHHIADRSDESALKPIEPPAAREIAQYDDTGRFRPLKTAPTLRRGWILRAPDLRSVESALDSIYPGALGLWRHWESRTLKPVPLRATLARQTGRYRFANTIDDDDANRLVASECDLGTKCLRRITWRLDTDHALDRLDPDKGPPAVPRRGEVPLICVEACTHLISAARERARNPSGDRDGRQPA